MNRLIFGAFPLIYFKLRAIEIEQQTISFYLRLSYFKKQMVWNYGTSQLASFSALFMKKNISLVILIGQVCLWLSLLREILGNVFVIVC